MNVEIERLHIRFEKKWSVAYYLNLGRKRSAIIEKSDLPKGIKFKKKLDLPGLRSYVANCKMEIKF